MEINVRNNNGRCAMALGGELTIYAAAELPCRRLEQGAASGRA